VPGTRRPSAAPSLARPSIASRPARSGRFQSTASETQFDRRSWALLGLAIVLIVVAFCVAIPSLYLGLARSGVLGDLAPSGESSLLIGLIGLTALFCLYMVHQHSELVRLRRKLRHDEMELEQSKSRLGELISLFQLGNTLHMDLPLGTVAEITVRRLASSLHSQDVTLFLTDDEGKTLVPQATFGLTARGPEPRAALGEGPVGWAARHREPILMQSSDRDARFSEFFATRGDAGSVLLLPVCAANRCVAVLQACRAPMAEPFRLEHRDIGQLFADNVAPVIDRAQAQLRARRTAAAAGAVFPPEEESAAGAFRDVFLSAAASELKAPLTVLVAYAEILDQNEKTITPATRREFSGGLRRETDRLVCLIDDVLDLVRLEMGRYLLDLRLGNVNQVIRAALESVRDHAAAKRITVDLDLDGSIPDQHLDPAKLRHAVGHMLRNAIRFSPERGRVRLLSFLTDEGVRVEIRDPGPPIPEDSSAAVFDLENPDARHARGKEGQRFGLHLARRFVELHGGSVGARTSADGGSTLWVQLPRGEDLSSLIGSDLFVEEAVRS
jgi:signal transduction histidine kinase